jgi:hypothetical protein
MKQFMDLSSNHPLYWDNVNERQMLGPELIQGTCDNVFIIKESMSTAQSRQKSYADDQRRDHWSLM